MRIVDPFLLVAGVALALPVAAVTPERGAPDSAVKSAHVPTSSAFIRLTKPGSRHAAPPA